MGYCERFFYCDNEKDTRRFLEMLEKHKPKNAGYEIAATMTFKKNHIIRYKEMQGIRIGNNKIPFNFPTELEIENEEEFYREAIQLPKELEELERLTAEPYYGEEQEQFFNKNETLIWITGARAIMADVYNLFGMDSVAVRLLLKMKKTGAMPDEWLVDGRIDIANVLPDAKRVAAGYFFTEQELAIMEKVKCIDLDGIEDIDAKLRDESLFRHKEYRTA